MATNKRHAAAQAKVNRTQAYGLDEAIALVKGNATAKFDETIEISLNLGIDPRHADQMVRGFVSLPNGTGKTLRVGVFARGAKAEEAQAAGADVVGADQSSATGMNSLGAMTPLTGCCQRNRASTHSTLFVFRQISG